MKAMMMIKALILIHLWSIIVACCAWGLQRDNGRRIGPSFPEPKIWLSLIILSLLPGVISLLPFGTPVSLPKVEMFETLPKPASAILAKGSSLLNYLTIYMSVCLLLMGRTLWRWSRLQNLPLTPTTEPDIFTTTSEIPPLTLSWPRRAVVIPQGLQAQAALIRHERAHLHHNDAELTLFLLLLQDVMLRTPGVSYLVRQWRLSIELRADHAATKMLTTPERKEYAALLLSLQRPSRNGGETLPCPTAQLSSKRHRNVKMRLGEIMKTEPKARKRRWGAAVLLMSIAASVIGLVNPVAIAKEKTINAGSGRVDYVQVDYVKRTPLQIPANCRGLKRSDVKIEEKELMVNGQLASQHTIKLGNVLLVHGIRRDGSAHNPRIIKSTHPCFEAEAKAAITQWMTEPQELEIRDAGVKLHFVISGATLEEVNLQLDDFLQ